MMSDGFAKFIRLYGEYQDALGKLFGTRIDAIRIDRDEQHYLSFDTDAGTVHLEACGDCCSESWFYHILGVKALLGHTITDIEIVKDDAEPPDDFSRQDYDRIYGVNFRTTGGMVDVEFRNSSNGYYGGWLDAVESIPAGVRMVAVTDDYTAQLYGMEA